MEKTNQTPPVEDKELEDLKGKVPGLEDDGTPSEKKEEENKPPQEDPAKKSQEEEGDDNPQKPVDDEEEIEEEEDNDKSKKPSRPEKYIPIKQYTNEKTRWREEMDAKEKRIVELEAITSGNDSGSKKEDAAVKAYAEKHGVTEESVRDLISMMRSEDEKEEKGAPKKEATLSPEQQAELNEAQELKAEKLFNDEYSNVAIPELKVHFPKATPEQLASAKKEIERIACTKPYLDKPLDFVVYKNRQALEKLFSQSRKGPEGESKPHEGRKSSYVANDFVGQKTPFNVLLEIPEAERNTIVEEMDIKTYESFMHWINQNDGLEVNRKGKKLKF